MPLTNSDTLRRLRAANPAPVEIDRGRSARAHETLERILADHNATEERPPGRIRAHFPRGALGIAVAVALVGGGAAVAATSPFGWWSANPDTAKYAVNPTAHVRTPDASAIRCRTRSANAPVCSPDGSGQLYTRIDTIRSPGPDNRFTRASFLTQIARTEAAHRLSRTQAAQFRHDLVRVPDSFFVKLRVGLRYGTYGGGPDSGRVPPPGVPEFLVCGQVASRLACEDLNGDEETPIGAAVYLAEQARDWRPAPPRQADVSMPAGLRFTPAEYRVLIDMYADGTVATSSSSAGPKRVQTSR